MSTPRTERRTLRERIKVLRDSTTRLFAVSDYYRTAGPLKGRALVSFRQILRQTRELALIVLPLNPNDMAWRYYEEAILKITEYAKEGSRWNNLSSYALGDLRHALEAVDGAASRIKLHWDLSKSKEQRVIDKLTRTMFWSGPEDREAARSVLADYLAQLSLVGEANLIRKRTWATDKKALLPLGIALPKNKPFDYAITEKEAKRIDAILAKRDPDRLRRPAHARRLRRFKR